MPLSEADTCRKYVLSKLYAGGWNRTGENRRLRGLYLPNATCSWTTAKTRLLPPSPMHGTRSKERRTDLLTECRAGIANFMVMAYIIFVNPSILGSVAGSRDDYLHVPAVLTVTCLTAGLLSLLMGFAANYPFALAPGMGLNAVVAFQFTGHLQLTWPQAMTIIFTAWMKVEPAFQPAGHSGRTVDH